MSVIITHGSSAAISADFTINAGDPGRTIFLTDETGEYVGPTAMAKVQIKSLAGRYFNVGTLTSTDGIKSIRDTGTYRVVRVATGAAFGVEMMS